MEIPRPEYPRPQFERQEWLNLNGEWEFAEDPGRSGEARGWSSGTALAGRIVVPFAPESKLSGIGKLDFMPCVWYRRSFSVPAAWADRRVHLHFGAVDYHATVWVNGQKAGEHRGGYVPFSFDITALLRPGENELVVRAVDETRSPLQPSGKQSERYASHGCHYTRTTGIWQTVWLEPVPEWHLAGLRLTPDRPGSRALLEVRIGGAVPGSGPAGMRLTARALVQGAVVAEVQVPATAPLTQIVLEIPGAREWSPEDPFLYDCELVLEGPGGVVDRVRSYFGLRQIELRDRAIWLNGRPLFQRLVLDQGFYPDGIYTAPSDDALRRDIELAQAMGFNGARLHEKVFEPRFLYWADRLGYLVWGEFPNWGLDHRHPEALERVLGEWLVALERDYNHPSLVGWCPFNETPNHQNPELIRTVYRLTKQIDPTRPVIDTSGYVHVETDIYDCHNYEQDPEKFAAAYAPLARGEAGWRNQHADRNAAHVVGQPYFVS
ncbi:MAG TPA: glycoside hydrolase family 2 TIM barrel-domain containing protein, partial [Limnochordia bacterium]